MSGSLAEERIRAKAETLLRQRWPDARIVHELVLQQGGVRIDLAAVGPDFLALVEIKSEKDVLDRLPRQLTRASKVADEVWICVAEKHHAKVEAMRGWWWRQAEEGTGVDALIRRARYGDCMRGVRVFVERDGGNLQPDHASLTVRRNLADPRALFDLLWAEEMRSALSRHFADAPLPAVSSKLTRDYMTRVAVESMSGREIRRAVCAQIRDRHFPRADARASMQEASSAV